MKDLKDLGGLGIRKRFNTDILNIPLIIRRRALIYHHSIWDPPKKSHEFMKKPEIRKIGSLKKWEEADSVGDNGYL